MADQAQATTMVAQALNAQDHNAMVDQALATTMVDQDQAHQWVATTAQHQVAQDHKCQNGMSTAPSCTRFSIRTIRFNTNIRTKCLPRTTMQDISITTAIHWLCLQLRSSWHYLSSERKHLPNSPLLVSVVVDHELASNVSSILSRVFKRRDSSTQDNGRSKRIKLDHNEDNKLKQAKKKARDLREILKADPAKRRQYEARHKLAFGREAGKASA
ncbi:hypothetical protein MRB53_041604 [Persea americana]|nr:hypothetical protein MRB53_041604 [Persea americana]